MKNEDILKQENGEALIIKKKIDNLYKKQHKLQLEINENNKKLQEICLHNDTEIKYSHIEGGYLDREQYITRLYCKICGTMLDEIIKLGGFG